MPKARTDLNGKRSDVLRSIPSMEKLLSHAETVPLAERYGRDAVKRVYSDILREVRRAAEAPPSAEQVIEHARRAFADRQRRSLLRVVNATGVLIHTNLGRAPVSEEFLREAAPIVASYSNLEFDLGTGGRGDRHGHLDELCFDLFGAEAALLVNNNASAALLVVAALASGKEVVVSRGELVEIGGAFRVPDVIAQGGSVLREVGTTNRTRAADYANAIGSATAALLRVHRSNFEIVGFTEQPEIAELVDVARRHQLPLIYDEGSGRVVDLARYGFRAEPTLREILAAGVDVVTCSTDKLIGATQGGLILGKRDLVTRCARHPLMRAMRTGKESFAIVAGTLRAFATGTFESRVPIYRMLATPLEELKRRAARIAAAGGGQLVDTRSALGGGTTPSETIASAGVAVPGAAHEVQRRLLDCETPIVCVIDRDRAMLDVRTIDPADDDLIIESLRAVQRR